MSEYSAFFLNSASSVVQLELFEILHPNFTQVYRIVRNAINGITVTLEDSTVHFFQYYPLQITPSKSSDDLDQILKINLGDLGQILPQELDAVQAANGFKIKPTLIYRTYRSDDLSHPLLGPLKFEIKDVPFAKEGASFDASAPKVNLTSTGEIYTVSRFPMLRGFM